MVLTFMGDIDLRGLGLPERLVYRGTDLTEDLLLFLDKTAEAWHAIGFLEAQQGYGIAATHIRPYGSTCEWNNPSALIGLYLAHNTDNVSLPGNAARKIRFLARARSYLQDNVYTTLFLTRQYPDNVQDPVVATEPDGTVRWGDFFHPGGVYATDGVNEIYIGISIYPGVQDNRMANAAAYWLLEEAAKIDRRPGG